MRDSWRLVLFATALLALLAPGGARAATVVNGNFETGDLSGWHVAAATHLGGWFAYEGAAAPIGSKRKEGPTTVQPPPQGAYAATTDEADPDTLILYQDVTLGAGSSQWLSLLVYYNSYKPIAVPTPDTLSVDEGVLGSQKNQQFRIDVMKPDAGLESVDPADILRTIFLTRPGDPQSMAPTKLVADLSAFAGQTVRLRVANAMHEEVFNAGIDAVSITSSPPGQSSPGSKGGPRLFSLGKVKVNRHKGTATLGVRVSGPGQLTAKGVLGSSHAASASAAKKPQKPIQPVKFQVASPRTVTLNLRPTASARRILRQKHKLRVKVVVTFKPTGGPAETASLPVMLRLEAGSGHRR
jgi:hypothetical protein